MMSKLTALELYRESVFAKSSMRRVVSLSNEGAFAGGVSDASMLNNMYKQIVNSTVWELNLPFLLCFAAGWFKDFPIEELDDKTKKNAVAMRRMSASHVDMNELPPRIAAIKNDENRGKAEERYREKLKDSLTYDAIASIRTMDAVEVFALIEDDALREVFGKVVSDKGQFSRIPGMGHVQQTVGRILAELPSSGGFLNPKAFTFKLATFDESARKHFQPILGSIQNLIIDSWNHHALHLLDAMSCFDFKAHRARVGDSLMFKDVPVEIETAYLGSFYGLRREARQIAVELEKIVEVICENQTDDEPGLDEAVADRILFYVSIQQMLDDFITQTESDSVSFLKICDISSSGFLKNPLPPI